MSVSVQWFRDLGFTRAEVRSRLFRRLTRDWLMTPYLDDSRRTQIVRTGDPVRYGTLYLAMEQIRKGNIPGSLAECGVYRGSLSTFIHDMLPERRLYLFDSFQGFSETDSNTKDDVRFRDTSEFEVLRKMSNTENVIIRKGFFPSTAAGLEDERFAFVVIDLDKYESTRAALEFFYPRTVKGGFISVHDYSSPESDWACSRALDEFLADKIEKPVLIPDSWGSALFRKA
jgi:O-methyltransferase